MTTGITAAGYDWTPGSRQLERDVKKRSRFRQHTRSMAMEGMGSRSSEMRLAEEHSGRDFTDAENAAWHNYIHKGGDKPGMGGGYGGGPGFGGPPGAGEAPVLNIPEYDEDKVSSLTQKRAAGGIRRLRETTQQAMSETYDNPNVKRMTVRDALAGYGTGLENVMAGAGRAASQEYGQQYAASVNAEMARYQGALNRQSQLLDINSQAWLMEQQYELNEEYSDPYEAFDAFYGNKPKPKPKK